MKLTNILVTTLLILSLNTAFAEEEQSSYPESASQKRKENFGSVLGGKGGISLYDTNPNAGILGGSKSGAQLNVNPFLWQASLNTLAFMPLASADSAGGVIVTDWYEDPNYPGERYKVNVLITSPELRVETLKITTFKQMLKGGVWREVTVNPQVSMDLEEKILTKARELKVGHD